MRCSRKRWIGAEGRAAFHLLWLHHAVVVKILVEAQPCRLRSLIRSTQGGDLAAVHGSRRLSHGVHRHQVDDGGNQHQQRKDGGYDQHRQVELPALREPLVGHHDDEDHQGKDEGEGCHGDYEALPRTRVIVVSPQTSIAVVVSGAIPAPEGPVVGTSPLDRVTHAPEPGHGSLAVPRQRGGDAGKYGHRQDDDDDGHDFEDPRWGRPLVEMLELVIWVVGIRRLRGGVAVGGRKVINIQT